MYQVAIDETDNHLCHLWLRLEGTTEPYLDILAIAETTGNGKDDSRDGHNGQQRGIGQCRRFLHHTLRGKEANSQQQLLGYFQQQESQWRHLIRSDSPDVGLKETDGTLQNDIWHKHVYF